MVGQANSLKAEPYIQPSELTTRKIIIMNIF